MDAMIIVGQTVEATKNAVIIIGSGLRSTTWEYEPGLHGTVIEASDGVYPYTVRWELSNVEEQHCADEIRPLTIEEIEL
jgi:hypothetical protein